MTQLDEGTITIDVAKRTDEVLALLAAYFELWREDRRCAVPSTQASFETVSRQVAELRRMRAEAKPNNG